MKKIPTEGRRMLFYQHCSRTRDAHRHLVYWYYGITEWYSGGCEKGNDRPLYTTKCAAI
ncbi:hypothetical protein E2C01_020265 [Portunus trituberculatus]|uniref:Uncharacterized protein n=1 Tax=Portunus trituberculatus TaxID=210409 RepID=A0A5B7E0U4_PORTR|nr:hypothetical protein [Portunus trituberculatus]